MDHNKAIRAARLGYILISAALCLLGALLIAVPEFSALLLCRIGGVLLILFGGIRIFGYLARDLYRLAFQYDLAFGILLIALGLVMLLRTNPVLTILYTMLGIFVLMDALLKIQIAIDSKVFGLGKWWLILSAAILTGIVGFLLILHPWESARVLTVLLGISLVTEGVLNLITIVTAVKAPRRPDIIDAEN